MRLSQDFTLAELVFSETATEIGLDNKPQDEATISRLAALATEVLQPARDAIGAPLVVLSGYRCPQLNAMIGGSVNPPSQHTIGEAADFYCPRVSLPELMYRLAIQAGLDYDQIIWEQHKHLIHISYTLRRPNRHQALIQSGPGRFIPYDGHPRFS